MQFVERFQGIADEAVMKMQHRLRRMPDLLSPETGSGYDSWLQWLSETGQATPGEEQKDADNGDDGDNGHDETPSQDGPVKSTTGVVQVDESNFLQPSAEYMEAMSSISPELYPEAPTALPTMVGWTDVSPTSAYGDPFILGLTGLDVLNFSNWNEF